MDRQQENKMGVMPVGRLLATMSVPIMISMLVQALYNVVDSMFVARIDEYALTALSMAFPIQNLMVAVAAGLGVGLNAVLSRALGARDQESVSRAAASGMLLMAVCSAVFMFGGATIVHAFYAAQTDIPEIIAYGESYTRIVMLGCVGLFFQIHFERTLQSTGRTVLTMVSQGLGAILNIILDPILIFGLCGMPRLEVAGAAVATVAGQIVAFVLALILNGRKNPDVHLKLRGFRPEGRMIRRILGIGVPSMIMVAIGSAMYYGFNRILMRFEAVQVGLGELGTAVFGAYFKLQSFIFMPVFGINNAVLAIAAYNYGARKPSRIMRVVLCGACGAATLMLLGIAAFQFFPQQLLALFNANEQMLTVGVPALKRLSLPFVFAGPCIIFGGVFQALGKSVYSMITSIARQIIVLLPAAYLLSLTGEIAAVWFAFPIAEIASLAVSIVMMVTLYRKKIKPLYAFEEKTT